MRVILFKDVVTLSVTVFTGGHFFCVVAVVGMDTGLVVAICSAMTISAGRARHGFCFLNSMIPVTPFA